jgi:hypothetical protein
MGKGTGCGGGQGAFVCCSFSGSDGHLVPCCFQIFFILWFPWRPAEGRKQPSRQKHATRGFLSFFARLCQDFPAPTTESMAHRPPCG